jgi:hypothetical protein
MFYHKGQTVDLKYRRSITKCHLLSYLGEFVSNNRTVLFKLATPLEDGRELVSYEVWEVLDLDTGMKDIKKLPVYHFEELQENLSTRDRETYIDDNNEVTSLLDNYSCWQNYCKLGESIRDRQNFHTKLVNEKHGNQIFRLKELDSLSDLPSNVKTGIRLKLIQKETPDHYVRRDFNLWKQQNPEIFTKIQEYVYKNDDFYSVVNSLKQFD